MRADHSAGALAIDVEIAYEEAFLRLLGLVRVIREDRSGQAVLGVIGKFECVLKIASFRHRENRAEDLLLKDARFRIYVGDNRRFYEIAVALGQFATSDQAAFFLAGLDVAEN